MLMAKLQHFASQAAVAARNSGAAGAGVSMEAASYRGAEALRALRTQRKYAAAGGYSSHNGHGSVAMSGRA